MTGLTQHQELPNNWEDREKLREKGQFWTPDWVAEAMVEYVLEDSDLLFDPAVGAGVFYQALKSVTASQASVRFYGTDIDEQVLQQDLYQESGCFVEKRDFIFAPPTVLFKSIVANPPYIRHHRLSAAMKAKLREISRRIMGFTIDGRAGLHIYFLIQALQLLQPDGKLAFIMPADTCEGVFADKLWTWITAHFRLECVMTFAPEATPFPNVDTNALVFLIKRAPPTHEILWVRSKQAYSDDLKAFARSGLRNQHFPSLDMTQRTLDEALRTGLSRPPLTQTFRYTLADFARVMRGIVTGANEFFFLTRARTEELRIQPEFLKPALGRTRDLDGAHVTQATLDQLERQGRPTLLFAPDGRKLSEFPETVQAYLRYGEASGIQNRILIHTRNPWYKMEQREIPPLLFAYLGRRQARFIRNDAGVVPLTCFLCVYPLADDKKFVDNLWNALQDPDTLEHLKLVGKSYGDGAIKVEPRNLENLPFSDRVVDQYYLSSKMGKKQLALF